MLPIGIDLGTTFSAIATISSNGMPEVIENLDGEKTTPSVIYFPENGEPIVGTDAKEYQAIGKNEVASFFKRNMGDTDFYQEFNHKKYSATELSSLVLKKLKNDAEKKLGQKIDSAVITVPAYFNDFQRNATIEAANLAEIKVLRLINEPTSAAIAYGVSKKGTSNSVTMVYDLGGGTFDVSLIKSSNSEITVIATDGDHMLGGKDWDDRIAGHLAEQFRNEFGSDPFEDTESFNDLLVRCEMAKKELSRLGSTKISIIHNGERGTYTLTRSKFEELTRDLLERTEVLARSVLCSAGLTWNDLDGVLLVGGSTRMPMVIDFVEKMCGAPPLRGINVDEAVALGAALQAASDLNDAGDFSLATSGSVDFALPTINDVTSHSLGMIATDVYGAKYINDIIIKKNASIPCENARDYSISTSLNNKDNTMEVYMLQGESDDPLECVVLGKYVFHDISHSSSKKAHIRVHYAYNKNGTVDVCGEQIHDSNKITKLRMTIEPVPEDMSWLKNSPAENVPPSALVLVIDISGSMEGRPLKEAKKAALSLIDELNFNKFHVGVVAFDNSTTIMCNCSDNKKTVEKAIDKLKIGSGTWGKPLKHAMDLMDSEEGAKYIVVLTDGCWFNARTAIEQSHLIKEKGGEIIAIGFGEADYNFLKAIATCDDNALLTDLSNLVNSFSKIGQVLSDGENNHHAFFN